METRCQRCDSPVGAEQAFCPNCGAVVGMKAATTQVGSGWDMASTVVGQRLPTTPPARSTTAEPRGAQAAQTDGSQTQPAKRGSNTVLLAVVGFVVVLLIGGLLLLLIYLNSQG